MLETKRLDQRLSEVEDLYLKSLGAEKRCAGRKIEGTTENGPVTQRIPCRVGVTRPYWLNV